MAHHLKARKRGVMTADYRRTPDRERSSRGGTNANKTTPTVDLWAAAQRFTKWYQDNYPEEHGQ